MNGTVGDVLPRPSDFPIGSPRSRAAARAMAERKISSFIRVEIVHVGRSRNDGLPPMQRIKSDDCVVEFVHTGGEDW